MLSTADKKTFAFGTDGVRGNAEQFPFTNSALFIFGRAVAQWAKQSYNKTSPKILIGADTRISGPRIKHALCQGMLSEGLTVYDAGVLPTPGVYNVIFYEGSFDAGIVISASHNPYHDNGIKLFDARCSKLSAFDEQKIVALFEQLSEQQLTELGNDLQPIACPQATDFYCNMIKSYFTEGFLKEVKVVLDCAHGATSEIAPAIFKDMGAEVITLAANPNGTNINAGCGALHPQSLANAVRENHAHCGFAFDGDGDRLIVVNRDGVVKDGDDILVLLSQHPAYETTSCFVGTIISNQGLQTYLTGLDKSLIRTSVGDKNVSAKLEAEQLPIGSEPSGHVIIRDYLDTSDGIYVALKVLESVIATNNWELQTFTKYPQVMINVPVKCKQDLAQQPFARIIAEHERKLDNGRLVVRYSGTENLLRVMTEAVSLEIAQTVAQDLARTLQKSLEGI
jgi:phosphoglucosamine mutase